MKKIYLSGPITGRAVDEYRLHFAEVSSSIRARAACSRFDVELFNPTSINLEHLNNPSWHDYMKVCIAALVSCDGIAVLGGWTRSRGSRLEISLADALHIPIVYIEPPLDELDVISLSAVHPELKRYWFGVINRRIESDASDALVSDRSLVELSNRFLDPHGFEYIEE